MRKHHWATERPRLLTGLICSWEERNEEEEKEKPAGSQLLEIITGLCRWSQRI